MLYLQSRSFLLLYSLTTHRKYWPITLTLRKESKYFRNLKMNWTVESSHRHINRIVESLNQNRGIVAAEPWNCRIVILTESWNRWIKIVESSQQNRGIVASESWNLCIVVWIKSWNNCTVVLKLDSSETTESEDSRRRWTQSRIFPPPQNDYSEARRETRCCHVNWRIWNYIQCRNELLLKHLTFRPTKS